MKVFTRVAKDRLGAFAETACVHEDLVAKKPAALTALQALRDELAVKPGMRIFIPGGAGGVGTFAIQLAKHLGAFVATTASPRGRALVERLGADVIVDYTSEDFASVLRDYDGAFDLVGGGTLARAFSVVRRGGVVVSIAGAPEPMTAIKDLGGNVALGDVDASGQTIIIASDRKSLDTALTKVGINQTDLVELTEAIQTDGNRAGSRVTKWIGDKAEKILVGGVKVSASIAQQVLTEMLMRHYGLKH